jgi:hypothetical protein
MPTTELDETARAIAEIIVATGGLGGAVLAAVKFLAPRIKRWYLMYTEMKAVFEKLPAFMETSQQIAHVTHELSPNNGSSLKDSVDRIEAMLTVQHAKQHAIWKHTDACWFYADADGYFTEVNYGLISMLRRDDAQLLGLGWLNLFSIDTRKTIAMDWEHAVKSQRNFEVEAPITVESRVINIRIFAEPLRNGNKVVGFAGIFTEIKKGR